MRLDWLADAVHSEGVRVIEHSGWSTRTLRPFDQYHPVGIIDHHTGGPAVIPNYPDPPFYRNSALETKCNLTIRPDGVAVVLNAGYAADSGQGSPMILEAVRNDRPLPPLDGLTSTISGNPWFVDIEVQHLGNGTPIVPVQREALIRANAAICKRLGWDPRTRVIGHREWAPDRKVDPRWDGDANPMPGIRANTYTRIREGDDEMAWTNPGDPVADINDARRVFEYFGPGIFTPADFAYDENNPALMDERVKVLLARVVDQFMQLNIRLVAEERELDGDGTADFSPEQIQAIVDQAVSEHGHTATVNVELK